ncbi:hypothetical protein BGX38DRAFT_422764 [Terfezia claveryi]|nr:hypothetical protein BGX38DRAFT_422764 [Terfezia claveryi]
MNIQPAPGAIRDSIKVAEEFVTPSVQQLPVVDGEIIGDLAMPLASSLTIGEAFHSQTEAVDSQIALTMAKSNAANSISGIGITNDKFKILPTSAPQLESATAHLQILETNSTVPSGAPIADQMPSGVGSFTASGTPLTALPPSIQSQSAMTKEQMFLESEEFKKLPPHLKAIHRKKAAESRQGSGDVTPQSGSVPGSNASSPEMKPQYQTSMTKEQMFLESEDFKKLPPHLKAIHRKKAADSQLGSGDVTPQSGSVSGSNASSPDMKPQYQTSMTKEQMFLESEDFKKLPPHLKAIRRKKAAESQMGSGDVTPQSGSVSGSNASSPDMKPQSQIAMAKEQMFLESEDFKKLPPHLKSIHRKKAAESQPSSGPASPERGSASGSNISSPNMVPHVSTFQVQTQSASTTIRRKFPTLQLYTPPHLRGPKANIADGLGELPLANAIISPTPPVPESNGSSLGSQEREISDIDITNIPPHLRHKYFKKATPPEKPQLTKVPLVGGNASPPAMDSNNPTSRSYLRPISPLTLNGQTSTVLGNVLDPNDCQPGLSSSSASSIQKPHNSGTDSSVKVVSAAVYPRGFFSQQPPPTDGRPVRTLWEETCSFIIPESKEPKKAQSMSPLDVPSTDQIARAVDIGAIYSATARAKRTGVAADDIAALIGAREHANEWLPKSSPDSDSSDTASSVSDGSNQKNTPGDTWQEFVKDINGPNPRRGRDLRRSPANQLAAQKSSPTQKPRPIQNSSPVQKSTPIQISTSVQKFISVQKSTPIENSHPVQVYEGKGFPSVEGKVSGTPKGWGVGTALSTIVPKAQIQKTTTSINTHAATPVEPSASAKLVQSIIPTILTAPNTTSPIGNADVVFPTAPNTVSRQKAADMEINLRACGGLTQYRTVNPSLRDNLVIDASVRAPHNTYHKFQYNEQSHKKYQKNQYNGQSYEKETYPSISGYVPDAVDFVERNPINEPSIAVTTNANRNTKPTINQVESAVLIETKGKLATTAAVVAICKSNNLTLNPTMLIRSIPSYDDNHIEETLKQRPRVRIPQTAPFPAPKLNTQGYFIESQAQPSHFARVNHMMVQVPPHMRARANLEHGYVDGDYQLVNSNAGVAGPKLDGANWEFAQTRDSMMAVA